MELPAASSARAGQPSRMQLHHQVAERIRTAILEGELQPGQWLRQERLAQEYGVSQMPVREALRQLAAEGLVEHVPFHGVRVIEFSPDDVEDLYAHRSFLEGLAARYAAENVTPEELVELRELYLRMKQRLAPEDLAEYRHLNRRFHELISGASRRAYLVRVLSRIWTTFPTMLWGNFDVASRSLPGRDVSDLQEHEALLVALENRDAEGAEALARRHVESAGRELVAALRRHSGRAASDG